MISSFDEAMSLFSKWKTEQCLIGVGFFNGPPDADRTVDFTLVGFVKDVSDSSIEFFNDSDTCCFRFDRSGTVFEYLEARDRKLTIKGAEKGLLERLTIGSLSVWWKDGSFCVFAVMREGTAFVRDEAE
jgi:hypothetical protein